MTSNPKESLYNYWFYIALIENGLMRPILKMKLETNYQSTTPFYLTLTRQEADVKPYEREVDVKQSKYRHESNQIKDVLSIK